MLKIMKNIEFSSYLHNYPYMQNSSKLNNYAELLKVYSLFKDWLS